MLELANSSACDLRGKEVRPGLQGSYTASLMPVSSPSHQLRWQLNLLFRARLALHVIALSLKTLSVQKERQKAQLSDALPGSVGSNFNSFFFLPVDWAHWLCHVKTSNLKMSGSLERCLLAVRSQRCAASQHLSARHRVHSGPAEPAVTCLGLVCCCVRRLLCLCRLGVTTINNIQSIGCCWYLYFYVHILAL